MGRVKLKGLFYLVGWILKGERHEQSLKQRGKVSRKGSWKIRGKYGETGKAIFLKELGE